MFEDTTDRDKDQLREMRDADRWGWCLAGRHLDCRKAQPAGDGTTDTCPCPCHRGEERT